MLDSFYNGSPSQALQAVYPEHEWLPWKFSNSPKGFWKKKENQKKFFDWLGKELGYKTLDDWYNITTSTIDKHGGGSMLDSFL